ncbi:MAG: MBL fold metallo-hydrolase [Methanospirillum sp.]|uniref:MBL fold metallo-hydrolase n=1 Tax=Methanospirillum sp. TaxID=45200 RepID=UPI00236CD724|nr:MBL fold metallo-hydrolase [Methanospirillum sp.]MDD1729106.1 MBL fold metallo-hydrolase [Methanospirillum sp.]
MRVRNLTAGSEVYTSNAYLCSPSSEERVSGVQENGKDCGILIDTGCDPGIVNTLHEIERESGTKPVCQIILTHSHYDHTKMLHSIKDSWNITSYAYSAYLHGIDQVIKGGEIVQEHGTTFELFHVPGHSTDSICVYCREEKLLFSGDSPLIIWGIEGTYELSFVRAFEKLVQLPVDIIYPGHGEPITNDCNRILNQSLRNLRKSRII